MKSVANFLRNNYWIMIIILETICLYLPSTKYRTYILYNKIIGKPEPSECLNMLSFADFNGKIRERG